MHAEPRPLARRTPRAPLAIALAGVVVLAAGGCTSSDAGSDGAPGGATGVSVEHLTIDAPANPTTSVLRMQVHNGSGRPDALVGVTTPVAAGASIHRTELDAQGRSLMVAEPTVPIPARSTVTFEPDGLHVMVTGVHEALEVGDEVPVVLTFRSAGKVDATAEVVPPGSTQEDHDGH